jgi:hypothetical protein
MEFRLHKPPPLYSRESLLCYYGPEPVTTTLHVLRYIRKSGHGLHEKQRGLASQSGVRDVLDTYCSIVGCIWAHVLFNSLQIQPWEWSCCTFVVGCCRNRSWNHKKSTFFRMEMEVTKLYRQEFYILILMLGICHMAWLGWCRRKMGDSGILFWRKKFFFFGIKVSILFCWSPKISLSSGKSDYVC